jgi:hypothetical protein
MQFAGAGSDVRLQARCALTRLSLQLRLVARCISAGRWLSL